MMDVSTPYRYVYNMLVSDSIIRSLVDTRVYSGSNKESTKLYPFIAIQQIPGAATENATADIIMYGDLIQVKAVDQSFDNQTVAAIINRAITLLHKTAGAINGNTIVACELDGHAPLPETNDNGVVYQEWTATFRIYHQ